MAPLIDPFGNQITPPEPKKNWWKRLVNWLKKHPKVRLGTFTAIISILAFLGIRNIFDIPKWYEKIFPKEIIFTDESGYKILLLRFQPYEDCPTQKTNIEIVIRDRLLAKSEEEELGLQVLLDTVQPWPRTFDDARKIGKEKGADLVIWGDLYERCYSDPKASLSYVVLDSAYDGLKKKGKSSIESIMSLSDVMKGKLQKDIDYVIYWASGQAASRRGDCKKIEFYLTKIFQILPQEVGDSYFQLTQCYLVTEKSEIAVNYLAKAIELDPDYAAVYFCRGYAKFHQEDFEGAIADYTKAIELDPEDAPAYNNRGYAKSLQEDFEGAIADYTIAIELDPENALIYKNLGNAKVDQRYLEGARADYTKAIELDPENIGSYSGRGYAKFLQGDFKGAINDFTKTIELDPENATTYNFRGSAKFLLEDFEGAIADYTKAIELDPNYTKAINSLKSLRQKIAESKN